MQRPLKIFFFLLIIFFTICVAVGNLVVMASGFGQEGPGSIPDAAKDPPSVCGVRARKIRVSGSPVVGR